MYDCILHLVSHILLVASCCSSAPTSRDGLLLVCLAFDFSVPLCIITVVRQLRAVSYRDLALVLFIASFKSKHSEVLWPCAYALHSVLVAMDVMACIQAAQKCAHRWKRMTASDLCLLTAPLGWLGVYDSPVHRFGPRLVQPRGCARSAGPCLWAHLLL